jgi:hypothetical protein
MNKVPARKFAKTRTETIVQGMEMAQVEQAERIIADAKTAEAEGIEIEE